MARRLDVDARKEQLAEAVWQVILDRGISAVSVRSVADQAGVVVGSLRHVFPTRAELMQFSSELMLRRATERVLAVSSTDDPEQYALNVIEQLLPLSADSRAEMEVDLALAAEAAALPELVAIKDEAHRQLQEVMLRLVELLSGCSRESTDMRASAQRLHALIDGIAFHLVHRSPDEDPGWALDIMRAEVSTIHSRCETQR
ncbi:TetR/AcrR family transcriptional regulator [Propioniferax innocua]|uniref:TetR family transcriptional regulator n=1 Tax=Propioniferax innocua TaxID=1753 RepID=A0A542ZC40_9ACTN|nr:TetR/AcrR family transcriptional regulator [Propioniferax innocua]TQL57820.1 TetR family transcriptional regulator [Propioniferax innocua]